MFVRAMVPSECLWVGITSATREQHMNRAATKSHILFADPHKRCLCRALSPLLENKKDGVQNELIFVSLRL